MVLIRCGRALSSARWRAARLAQKPIPSQTIRSSLVKTSCRGLPVSPETTSAMRSLPSMKASRTRLRMRARSTKSSATQRACASRARATAAATASRSAIGYSATRAPVAGLRISIVRRTSGSSTGLAPWAMEHLLRSEIRGSRGAGSTTRRSTRDGISARAARAAERSERGVRTRRAPPAGARGGKPLADLGCLGLEERVQAALRLGLPGPAAAPLVAAGERRPRARRAADARVPLLEERMGGDTVTLEVVERVLRRPRRQRVHLVEGTLLELLDDRDRRPRRRLIPPPTVDPGTHAREIALERLDLVDVAAEVRVARVEVEAVARGELGARHDRLELDEPESQAAHDLVTVGEGLGEVEPRVDEHDRRLGGDRMQHVGEDDAVVLEGAGEHHVGPKALPRPRENPFRSLMLELAVPLGDRHVATVTQGYGTGNAARRLSHQRAPL